MASASPDAVKREVFSPTPDLASTEATTPSPRAVKFEDEDGAVGPLAGDVDEGNALAAQVAVAKEDVKPAVGYGRRSTRARASVSYAEVLMLTDDEENVKPPAPGGRETSETMEEHEEEGRQQRKRRRVRAAGRSPSAVDEKAKEDLLVKVDEIEVVRTRDYRPACMEYEGFNLYRPASWECQPILNVSNAATERTAREKRCHRYDMRGNPVKTYADASERPEYGTDRGCFKAKVNLGIRVPGQAFAVTTDYTIVEDAPDIAVFVQRGKGRWEPFGIYRRIWCGTARPSEYEALSLDERDKIIDVFMTYLLDPKPTSYNLQVFENTVIYLDPAQLDSSSLWATRNDPNVTQEQQRNAIDRCLRENKGLNVVYVIKQWVGLNDKELADIRAREPAGKAKRAKQALARAKKRNAKQRSAKKRKGKRAVLVRRGARRG
ncbi:hypothetical protein JCM10449v2_002491 [Rhodotorula kratochvilovae]